MTITWTRPAHDDFLGIVAWIKGHNPAAATRVGRRILDAVEQLDQFPLRGRPGRAPGTRELVIAGRSYWVPGWWEEVWVASLQGLYDSRRGRREPTTGREDLRIWRHRIWSTSWH